MEHRHQLHPDADGIHVKYEDIYLRDYGSVPELDAGLARYFRFYNQERPHQSLGYRTPAAVHGVVTL